MLRDPNGSVPLILVSRTERLGLGNYDSLRNESSLDYWSATWFRSAAVAWGVANALNASETSIKEAE
jgi:hypothetical protein